MTVCCRLEGEKGSPFFLAQTVLERENPRPLGDIGTYFKRSDDQKVA